MKTNPLALALPLVGLAALMGCAVLRGNDTPVASDDAERGFVRIFNGRDLSGWIGATNLYFVENGDLVFREGPKNYGNLFYHRPFTNFTARFSFKLVPNGNNGFAVRAGRDCVDGGALVGGNKILRDAAYNGMEIQVLDDTGDKKQHLMAWQYHGSIYGVVAAQRGALRPVGAWNDEEVTVDGDNVTVVLNGKTILATSVKDLPTDGTTPDGKPHPGLHNPSGYIGFLGHTMPVRFRDIRVKDLPPAPPVELAIATFNVRGIMKQDTGERHWERRIPRIARTIRANGFDIAGLQECRHRMANAILADLPGYAGTGPALDDPEERHPGNVILYKTNVLTCVASREIWLSDTPDVPFSKHAASSMTRTCLDATFVERATGRRFHVLNAHLDHKSDAARLFGARVILEQAVRPAKARGEPVFLMGDMNKRLDPADTAASFAAFTPAARKEHAAVNAIACFLTEMDDTIALVPHEGPFPSFRGWGQDKPRARIDYIFVAPNVTVRRHATIMDTVDGHFPSDHCPVVAEVAF